MEEKVDKSDENIQTNKDCEKEIAIIVLSDDSEEELTAFVEDNNKLNTSNEKGNESILRITQNQIKAETTTSSAKSDSVAHITLNDSYDEIEERLKQICDGGFTEDENNPKKESVSSTAEVIGEELKITNEQTNKNITHNDNSATSNETKSTDKENLEIIFGTESGDEKGQVCKSVLPNNISFTKSTKTDVQSVSDVTIIIKEEKNFSEDIEDNFTKDEVHVIPNMKAAMKRKRRTREEIMKSIKKSIKSVSDQELNTTNSDSSDVGLEIEDENDMSVSSSNHQDTDGNRITDESAKFVIKVTGNPSDVIEIMDELSGNAIRSERSSYHSKPNDEFITSTITVYSRMNTKGSNNSDQLKYESSPSSKIGNSESFSLPISNCQSEIHRSSSISCNEEHRNPNVSGHLDSVKHDRMSPPITRKSLPQNYETLVERLQLQETVIAQLTDQLIIYKASECNTRNRNSKEGDVASAKMNTRLTTAQITPSTKKSLETKQRLIDDLSNRIAYFEEMNKKLMKTVTLESQQKRKLESQMKQKDTRIKELNWKLEKASKFLERAEKNTNTYRRKMLNMQTIMRRKKLLDEKMSKFNEMLADSAKQEFSEKDLAMAVEIKRTCGKAGYEKLLSYGFPLPPLIAVRKVFPTTECSYHNENVVEKVQNISNRDIKVEKSDKEPDEKKVTEANSNDVKPLKHIIKSNTPSGAETVTKTVQDIFNENNDGDEFSTNELREHFILQLNAVM